MIEDVRLLLDWMEGRLGIIDMTTSAVGKYSSGLAIHICSAQLGFQIFLLLFLS